MKLLFVCTAGQQRSPTAAKLFEGMGYLTDYAGIHGLGDRGLSAKKLEWADLVIVMEEFHRAYIKQHFPEYFNNHRIHVLNIPDIYYRDDPELIENIKEKMETVL